MSRPRVFVTRIIPEEGLARVRAACDADVWDGPLPPSYETLVERTRECDGLLSLLTDRVDAALMDACPRLRVISNFAVGFNNIDIAAATERGLPVGNTPGVLTDATADMAFCLLIAAARQLVAAERSIRDGEWRTWEPMGFIGQDLVGATLGILGMGRVGAALAARCHHGFGMRVLYTDPLQNADVERDLGAERVAVERLLAESDFVSLHANLDDATRGMIDAAALAAMKPNAVLVNTARGPLVDQAALLHALRSGEIFAAGLDVTDPEPMAADDPLLAEPRCIVAPHIASATVRTRGAMAEIAADNLLAGLDGRPLRHSVNPEVAPRTR